MNYESGIMKKDKNIERPSSHTSYFVIHNSSSRGFTLFIAVIVSSLFLAIGFSLASLSVKQQIISSIGKESQFAFYAADTGIECALYWDFKGTDVFATPSQPTPPSSDVKCNNLDVDDDLWSITTNADGSVTTKFAFDFPPQTYCAMVTVTKSADLRTKIESRGYNNASRSLSSCQSSNPRTVERAIRVNY